MLIQHPITHPIMWNCSDFRPSPIARQVNISTLLPGNKQSQLPCLFQTVVENRRVIAVGVTCNSPVHSIQLTEPLSAAWSNQLEQNMRKRRPKKITNKLKGYLICCRTWAQTCVSNNLQTNRQARPAQRSPDGPRYRSSQKKYPF